MVNKIKAIIIENKTPITIWAFRLSVLNKNVKEMVEMPPISNTNHNKGGIPPGVKLLAVDLSE